jgi:hypothetical protein
MTTDTTRIGMRIQVGAGQMARTNRLDRHNRASRHNRHISLGHVLASRSVRRQSCVVIMTRTSISIRVIGSINSRRIATRKTLRQAYRGSLSLYLGFMLISLCFTSFIVSTILWSHRHVLARYRCSFLVYQTHRSTLR